MVLLFWIGHIAVAQTESEIPEGRASGSLVYHPKSKSILLIDGYQIHKDSTENDVWKWDGKHWNKLIAYGPGTRSLSAIARDNRTGSIVVFGGIGKNGYETKLRDTWMFDGSRWQEIATNDIGTRDHHKMVFADALNAFIMYGGVNADRASDTLTWVLRDTKFTSLQIPGPGPRYHFGLAYDQNRKRVVLYGGGEEPVRDELWEFDGHRWIKVSVRSNPGKRLRHNLIYDPDLKMVLLHGGLQSNDLPADITWGWDGKAWHKIANGGPVGDSQAMGYDDRRKAIVVYSGMNPQGFITSALWELRNNTWTKVVEKGSWRFDESTKTWVVK